MQRKLGRGAKGLLHMHLNFSAFKISGSLNFFTSICIHIFTHIYIYIHTYIPQSIYAAKRPSPHFLIEGILIQCLGCSSPSPRPKKQIGCHRWSPLKPSKIAIDLGADIFSTYVFFLDLFFLRTRQTSDCYIILSLFPWAMKNHQYRWLVSPQFPLFIG